MKKQSFLEANLWQKQLSLLPLVDFFLNFDGVQTFF